MATAKTKQSFINFYDYSIAMCQCPRGASTQEIMDGNNGWLVKRKSFPNLLLVGNFYIPFQSINYTLRECPSTFFNTHTHTWPKSINDYRNYSCRTTLPESISILPLLLQWCELRHHRNDYKNKKLCKPGIVS